MQEKYQADYVRMAYNELLQNAVEGGLLGLLLFIGIMVPLLVPPTTDDIKTNTANRQRSLMVMTVYAGAVAYAIMSLMNFTIQAIPGLCLFIIYAAILVQLKPTRQYRINKNMAGSLLILTGLYFFITQTLTTSAQWQNHKAAVAIKKMRYQKAGRLLTSLSDRLNTSDSYWQNYGQLLLEQKRYLAAVAVFNKAKVFTSSPEVYLQTGYCYEQTGQMANAEKEFDMVAWMVPNRLTARYALLQLYLKTNDTAAALKQAREMIAIHEKVPSAKGSRFKKEADSVIRTLSAPLNNITQSQIQ
jgi:tetratricopeptide (TPR) repeat protein